MTVRVGDGEATTDVPVYRALISAASPYFKAAFEGGFKEAEDRLLTLNDVSEQAFRLFLTWLHAQHGLSATTTGTLVTIPPIDTLLPPGATVQPLLVDPGEPKKDDDDIDGNSDGEDEVGSDTRSDASSSPSSSGSTPSILAVDVRAYHDTNTNATEAGPYLADPVWLTRYGLTLVVAARLYIFAHKYRVVQLEDDIVTALFVQSYAWGDWWPDPEAEVVALIYSSLPRDCDLTRLLVHCSAFLWATEDCCRDRIQILRDMHTDFMFDVCVLMANALKGHENFKYTRPTYFEDGTRDSCEFRGHLPLDKASCRKRITNYPHIFTALIEGFAECARAKAGMT